MKDLLLAVVENLLINEEVLQENTSYGLTINFNEEIRENKNKFSLKSKDEIISVLNKYDKIKSYNLTLTFKFEIINGEPQQNNWDSTIIQFYNNKVSIYSLASLIPFQQGNFENYSNKKTFNISNVNDVIIKLMKLRQFLQESRMKILTLLNNF